jgi:predicted metal-dependent hydrolase
MLAYGDILLPYEVQDDPRRSTKLAIHVDSDGRVSVDAPVGFSDQAIKSAVQKRARWITNHVRDAQDRFREVRPREYISGEQVFYLGRRYVLKVVLAEKPVKYPKLKGNRLEVQSKTGEPDDIRGRMRAWYRIHARDYFARRLQTLAQELPWVSAPPAFRLLAMSQQWGSCNAAGELNLNPNLIKAPRPCIDYVLIHELAHLKHHDHGKDFWAILDRYVAEWPKLKQQLDDSVEIYCVE